MTVARTYDVVLYGATGFVGHQTVAYFAAHAHGLRWALAGRNRAKLEAVRAACEGKIARYKLPRSVVFIGLDEFPRSTTGKVKRHELEARLHTITATGATP